MDIIFNETLLVNAEVMTWSVRTSEECTLEELVETIKQKHKFFEVKTDEFLGHTLFDRDKYSETGEKLKDKKVELVKMSDSWGQVDYYVKSDIIERETITLNFKTMGKEKTKAEIMEELRKKNEELEAKSAELEAKSAEVELIKEAQKTLAESYDKRVQELKEVKEELAKATVDRDSFDKTAKKLFADKNELLFKVDTLKAEKQALNQRLRDAEVSFQAARNNVEHWMSKYNELIGKGIFGFLKEKWNHKKK